MDRQKVAIIGSGLAGLTTAHILHADPLNRYALTIFEQAPSLSFDSASVSIKNNRSNVTERIDLPMRAAAGALSSSSSSSSTSQHQNQNQESSTRESEKAASVPGCYFVHASNLHQTPPPWPANRGFLLHVVEILFLIVCQFWFTAACFLIPPTTKPKTADPQGETETENLAEYLERIWLPRRYISHYLLPLMSSVSTCSHNELLEFPASDVINYKKLSQGQQHYVSRLVEGITDIRLGVRVLNVQPSGQGVSLKWMSANGTDGKVEEQLFDRVVLAVSPDVAGRIFAPVQPILSTIPTRQVESSVLDLTPGSHTVQPDDSTADSSTGCSHHTSQGNKSQVITFRTQFSESGSHTEALHAMPSGVFVQTCPLDPTSEAKGMLQAARFTRTLRTTQSRQAVERIMGSKAGRSSSRGTGWVNGEDNVWLTGAWCWDGMVLLEGCIVSAMRVAKDFGVVIPWENKA
ncbi:hypothetical protein PT974_07790 [Cladobotryum mycophilum]|uniref:Amine oxidase domain-containing protein n=1 Tax=Cladobotryum mycophilum TaxID=491253 RepID=A0ABR0SIT4_9HYPO